MAAPTSVPDIDTVPKRYPSHATRALTPIAHGSADSTIDCDPVKATGDVRLTSHNTSAADAGTERENGPRRGDDVEASREDQNQQQNCERVEEDAKREAPGFVDRSIQAASTNVREHQRVEQKRRAGKRGCLPPGEESKQQRKRSRADVHPLSRFFGMRRHRRASSVRRRPSASGVIR